MPPRSSMFDSPRNSKGYLPVYTVLDAALSFPAHYGHETGYIIKLSVGLKARFEFFLGEKKLCELKDIKRSDMVQMFNQLAPDDLSKVSQSDGRVYVDNRMIQIRQRSGYWYFDFYNFKEDHFNDVGMYLTAFWDNDDLAAIFNALKS